MQEEEEMEKKPNSPNPPQEPTKITQLPSSPPSSAQEPPGHPYDFHVSGPRNLSSPNWRDLIKSSWKDPKYKRMAIACFVQAVYLLELDRQDSRTDQTALAPKWWKPFKFKLAKTLIDQRDGSIYGAVLEWDRSAALADLVLLRPRGAPRAVLALRGTLLRGPTIRRDLEDDLRFLTWESLKGSVRFDGALEELKSLVRALGGASVCVGGHSLGAGFALQVGKALAKEGVFVECHLFNPPSVSIAMSFRSIGERAGHLWRRVRGERGEEERVVCAGIKKWVPNLYVNSKDYICCHYTDPGEGKGEGEGEGKAAEVKEGQVAGAAARLFVMAKGPQKFLEAHGLEQWWADDMELQLALSHSKLINRQLKSLYTAVQ